MTGKLKHPNDVHIPGDMDNEISKEERERMQVLVFRRWPPFLNGAEQKIVMFIYDRTVHYNRRWAYVSTESLEHGYPFKEHRNLMGDIWSGDRSLLRRLTPMERSLLDEGDMFLTAPTGLSRRHIMRALPALIERRFVFRSGHRQEPQLALNPDAYYDYTQILFPRPRK